MDFASNWIKIHLQDWKYLRLEHICLPTAHDAGAYHIQWSTTFGLDSNVVTQKKTILQQLELGVRRFDIRPKLIPKSGKPWSCGHGTDTGLGPLGWQGGLGATIQSVVDDINTFTKGREELIFLDIHEIQRIDYGMIAKGDDDFKWKSEAYFKADPSEGEWLALLDLLKGINYLYTEEDPYPTWPFRSYRLGHFLNSKHQSSVVAVVDRNYKTQDLLERGLWPSEVIGQEDFIKNKKHYLDTTRLDEPGLCRMQADVEAVISTVLNGAVFSVEDLAKKQKADIFPILLQRVLSQPNPVEILEMDFIENPDLLTFCLAISRERCSNLKSSGQDDLIIYYCAKQIGHPNVKAKLAEAINAKKPFKVSDIDVLDVNPAPAVSKCCAAYYIPHTGQSKGRYGRQDGYLHFEQDI